MARVSNLAGICDDCDAVAHTGDCGSVARPQAPVEWNAWPQSLKLAVPGNHDRTDTFALLPTWKQNSSWACPFKDLMFVGLHWRRPISSQIFLRALDFGRSAAVVALCHERPVGRPHGNTDRSMWPKNAAHTSRSRTPHRFFGNRMGPGTTRGSSPPLRTTIFQIHAGGPRGPPVFFSFQCLDPFRRPWTRLPARRENP
jgi:hypothetical protein